jgi:glucose-6-phosphate isomerase, archaeal
MLQENDYPISVQFDFESGKFDPTKAGVDRRVSDLSMMFADKAAVEAEIKADDKIVYDIAYHPFETSKSDMALGVTRIRPGKVGDEYHFTKGHYHTADNQPEIYFCVKGEGYLFMQTHDGEFRAERWTPGTISHIPPMWAHRVVNTGDEMLVFVASYHTSAGHDYEPIMEKGFVKMAVEQDGEAVLVDNERWK